MFRQSGLHLEARSCNCMVLWMLNLFPKCLKIAAGPELRSAATGPRRSCPRAEQEEAELMRRTLPRRRGRTRERERRQSRGGTPTSTTEITVS